MNIDFELYRIFYTVANHKNITKASEELNISQPAISKSIKNLENQLGGQLFVRTKRGVTLTEEGKEFYNYIKQAIEYPCRMTCPEITKIIDKTYKTVGIEAKAKAADITKWFDCKKTSVRIKGVPTAVYDIIRPRLIL